MSFFFTEFTRRMSLGTFARVPDMVRTSDILLMVSFPKNKPPQCVRAMVFVSLGGIPWRRSRNDKTIKWYCWKWWWWILTPSRRGSGHLRPSSCKATAFTPTRPWGGIWDQICIQTYAAHAAVDHVESTVLQYAVSSCSRSIFARLIGTRSIEHCLECSASTRKRRRCVLGFPRCVLSSPSNVDSRWKSSYEAAGVHTHTRERTRKWLMMDDFFSVERYRKSITWNGPFKLFHTVHESIKNLQWAATIVSP